MLSDQQGGIASITDSTGAVVVGESFTAYGNRRNPTTWSGAPSSGDLATIAGITRHGYTFQDALGSMGLNDMIGRVQDVVTGRFLSPDPTTPHPLDSQSYNPYSYVRNNPLTYTDPTGFADGHDSGLVQWINGPWDIGRLPGDAEMFAMFPNNYSSNESHEADTQVYSNNTTKT